MLIITLTISFQKSTIYANDEFLYKTIRDVEEERNCLLDFNFVTLIKSSINNTE